MRRPGMIRLLFLALVALTALVLLTENAHAATYYVSPTGSDSNSGTSSAPFKTIQKAANIVNPGDTVIVKNGIYTDTNGDGAIVKLSRGGTSTSWITFRSESKWGAVLDGQNNTADYCWQSISATSNYIRIEDFEMRNAVKAAIFNLGEHDIAFYGNYIHDTGRILYNGLYGREAIYAGSGSRYTFDSNIFHSIGRLNPYTTPSASEASCTTPPDYVFKGVAYPNLNACYNHDHALYLVSTDNVIVNNIFHDLKSGWAVMSGGSGDTIVNNTFFGDNPSTANHAIGQILVKKPGTIIYNNIFYGDGDCGILTYESACGGSIKNNIFYPNIDIRCNTAAYPQRGTWTISGNIVNQNPKFRNAGNHDFHLQTGSPAINKGLDIPGYDYDADGNPIVGLPDLGAYEYAGDQTDTTAPSVPAGLTATAISSSQINLAWTASTDNVGVSGYKVYRNGGLVATVTKTSYSDTGLTPSTTYTYKISAFDGSGNTSAQSAAVSATTKAGTTDTQAPTVPTGLTATAVSSSKINLAWTASTDNVGVAGYKVYRGTSLIATVTGTSYSNTGLTPSTTYTYKVAAFDGAGNGSAQSSAASATTKAADAQAPTVPTGLKATAVSSTQINLTWTASSDNVGVSGYKVYRGTSLIATVTGTSYSNTGLTPSTTYTYKVAAFDGSGNTSAQSAAVSATTLSGSAMVTLNSLNDGVTLSSGMMYAITWSAPSNAVTFDLFYSPNNGTSWQAIATGVSGNSYDWQVPALKKNSTKCLLKIVGYDASGKKIDSDISDATFTILVARLRSPNGGQALISGANATITWRTYSTIRPVAGALLKYTVDGGRTWRRIGYASGNPGTYSWQLPSVSRKKEKCRVAVILKDADGRTVGVDSSDTHFAIQP